MADNFDNYGMKVQATASVKMPTASEIDKQIRNLEKSISKLQISGKLDDSSLKNLSHQLDTLKATITTANFSPTALTELTNQVNRALQNINIGNINVGNVGNQAQQVGQQIGNAISQGVADSTNGVSQATDKILRDFSELNDAKRKFVDGSELISKEDIADANKFYQTVREAFKEFGQVTISKGEMTDGELESLRVKIQQVNGELKTTREFMLYLNQSSTSPDKVKLADDDTIKTTERMVQHLNEAKNITNATGDEANALKQKLAEQEKYYDKLEQASKEQLAIEKQRITAGEKQLEVLDKQSKRRDSRISYNEGQIDKKGLTNISRVRDINDMVSAGNEKYDSAFAKEIDKNISSLSKLKDKWKEQGVYVDEFKTKVETLENALNNIDSGDVKGLNSIKQQMETLSKEASQIADVNRIQHSLEVGDYDAQIETIKKGFVSLSGDANEAETHVKGLRDALQSMHDATDDNGRLTAEKNYRLELEKTDNQLTIAKAKAKEYVDVLKVQKLRNDIQDWLRKNTAATKEAKDAVKAYLATLDDIGHVSQSAFNEAKQGLDNWDTQMRVAGKLGKSPFETFKEGAKSFASWTLSSGSVMEVVNAVKQGVDELKDLDDILTEISKTSDLTKQQLKELGDTAFESASKYGKSASDYLTGVQEMYRAGFDNASEMAELSVLAQSAGDMETNLANDYLLATNAAYKYKGSIEELNKVLDSQNYITNNAAISMKDIADATTETASVAAQYGVQIDELSALIATATANTRESGSEVGTALKAILINLQDTTSKPVTETFDALGISMTKVVNGAETLKTPIELIHELADAYNSLPEGDVMRANILNEIGQKRHANTLASILSDMEGYRDMLDLYNSTSANDSAFREAQKSAENWSGTWNKVKNTWSDLLQNFANTDVIVGALNVLNDFIGALDKLGAVGTLALGGGLFAGIKNVGQAKMVACLIYAYPC